MENTNIRQKYLTVIKYMDEIRIKLFATYELFVAQLEQSKTIKADLGAKYEQLLDLHSEYVQIANEGKPARVRVNKIRKDAKLLKEEHDEQVKTVKTIMDKPQDWCDSYIQGISSCCKTYDKLKAKHGQEASVKGGYIQQGNLVKRILEKIKEVKLKYKGVREDVKIQAKMFQELFTKINEEELVLK